jgi:hypothetical protein
MKRVFLLSLVLGAAILAACSSATTEADVCVSVDQVNDAVAIARLVTPQSDQQALISANTQLLNSWSTLMSDAEKLNNEKLNAALAPANEVIISIPAVTQQTPPAVAVETIQAQANAADKGIAPVVEYCHSAP